MCVRSRCGSARSSKKSCMNSSLVSVKVKSSSPSPLSLACDPRPLPPWGRSMRSPRTCSVLPGCTTSRMPPWPWWNAGSLMSLRGMVMLSACSMSRMPRFDTARRTLSAICSLKRRTKRSRLPTDLFLPASLRSMICSAIFQPPCGHHPLPPPAPAPARAAAQGPHSLCSSVPLACADSVPLPEWRSRSRKGESAQRLRGLHHI